MRILLAIVGLIFSTWLMFHTFSYDGSKHQMLIAGKAWSDFGGHIPLIRSFTYGRNWPPQNPLFPGEPIRYHFLFYFLVGFLEQAGLRIDIALNSLSILGFLAMLVLIYLIAHKLFTSKAVAYLAVIFLLFNGSLSFLKYFAKNGVSYRSLTAIPSVSQYPSFGPWDGGPVAAFWSLNIFTNQRHLAPSIALALLVIYILLHLQPDTAPIKKVRIGLLIGLVAGILIFANQAIFACLAIFLAWAFILYPSSRLSLLTSFLVVLPAYLYSLQIVHLTPSLQIQPGFLINGPLTIQSFFSFWFHNLGLHLIFIPIGVLLAPRKARGLILPMLTLFFIGNYFRLSPDMFNNHKLFNFIIIFINMYSSLVIVKLWHYDLTKPLAILLTCLLVFSGIIDFFALKNDNHLTLADIGSDPDVQFFLSHTKPHDIILNSTWFYHPASLAGRSIFSGYTYFTWSHGYDQTAREAKLLEIYRAPAKAIACAKLSQNNIAYVELKDHPEDYVKPNWQLWQTDFTPVYRNPSSGLKIYSVAQNCL